MPQVFLKIKADLENIKCLTPVKNNYWKFDIQTPTGEYTIMHIYL